MLTLFGTKAQDQHRFFSTKLELLPRLRGGEVPIPHIFKHDCAFPRSQPVRTRCVSRRHQLAAQQQLLGKDSIDEEATHKVKTYRCSKSLLITAAPNL